MACTDELKIYAPQGGPRNLMRLTQRPITPRTNIVLRYPVGGSDDDATFLYLRRPELNNKIVPRITLIQRDSRGGEHIQYRRSDWSKAYVLNWAFRGLTSAVAKQCLEFSSLSCGDEILLLDYESRSMRGIMLNPNNSISQEGPDYGGQCGSKVFTWKFDFQGVYV